MSLRIPRCALVAVTAWLAAAVAARAHPHVFAEVNLELVRGTDGALVELRHVWRFDELFSSTVLVDFDENGNGELDTDELDEVSAVVTESIGENDFFTLVRQSGAPVPFKAPERILVDYSDGQILMFFPIVFDKPVAFGKERMRISVSDPTYYVAMDIADEAAVRVAGGSGSCKVAVQRPDFDTLNANAASLGEQYFADTEKGALGDEWRTWIDIDCE